MMAGHEVQEKWFFYSIVHTNCSTGDYDCDNLI